jgi:hypothetical protein
MNVAALQEFLRSLGSSLAWFGIPPKTVDDLRAAVKALEPFKELDLEQLADFLRRAAEYRDTGAVPALSVPGLEQVTTSARTLSETVHMLRAGNDDAAARVEGQLAQGQRDLRAAIASFAEQFGITARLAENKKWLPELRAKSARTRAVEIFRKLASQISEPASYQSEAIKSAIEDLAATDSKSLKAAAVDLGLPGTGSGRKLVESVLVRLTGIDSKPPKAPKIAKPEEPHASEEQVEAISRTLQEMVARAKDPSAVPDTEIDAILSRASSEFSTEQLKSIARRVTGNGGRSAKDAIDRLRADLTAVKRLLVSQRV